MTPLAPILMTPAFRYGAMTPWGGDDLARLYHKPIPDPRTGESLEVSAIPGLESRDAEGASLPELLARYGARQASLEEIFSTADVITVHTPLFDETEHLIDGRLLSMIKPGALFVNTSRGKIVDEAALCRELSDGRFRAFLDVFEKEPPLPESPLYTLPNVFIMPHMAGPTVDLRKMIAHDLLIESAGYIDRGEPLPHEITRARASKMSVR